MRINFYYYLFIFFKFIVEFRVQFPLWRVKFINLISNVTSIAHLEYV